MHANQITTIRRYWAAGFTLREIANLTGYAYEDVQAEWRAVLAARNPLDEKFQLRLLAERLLKQATPHWWRGTRAEYERCVRANFGDVMAA